MDDRSGIILQDIHQLVEEGGPSPVPDILQNGVFKRIVHHAVQLFALKITAAFSIAGFVGGVFPYLPQEQSLRVLLLHRFPQSVQKHIGKLISYIQPETGSSQRQPVSGDSFLPTDEFQIAGSFLCHLRKGLKAPPGSVFVGILLEGKPIVVWAFLGLIGAYRVIATKTVEIDAVASHMAEYPVKDHRDSQLSGGTAQGGKILVGAQQRIYMAVIGGIVAMVGMGFKDGVEIDTGNPQRSEIFQLFLDPLEIPAGIVGIGDLPTFVGQILRRGAPGFQFSVGGDVFLGFAAVIKPVGKDLIHGAAF